MKINRVKYFNEIYPAIWKRQNLENSVYDDDYCRNIVNLICSTNPKTVFELAIGSGWPIAIKLKNLGIEVSGCDISNELINQLKKNNRDIKTSVLGYDKLETNKRYDVVYCVRSSWYFENIFEAIEKMLNITRKQGEVIFDIMNASNNRIKLHIRKNYLNNINLVCKNLLRFVINIFINNKYQYAPLHPIEVPYQQREIEKFLDQRNLCYKKYSYNQITKVDEKFDDYSFRIIYVVSFH
jgi:SAM-dependent methyltransferase|tara:strand:- start:314 stop:1030 length:717 start_codon:yes stop_codon:yes gene_type:complete